MPRTNRNITLAGFYHVMLQGNEKKDIFEASEEKNFIINLLLKNAERDNVKIISYCVMSNHIHIILHCSDINDMSKLILQTATAYGERYNEKHERIGHVFRDRFKSIYIDTQAYLIKCIKYVHNNPVKAHIVKTCRDYAYSSFRDYYYKNNIFTRDLCRLCSINKDIYKVLVDMDNVDFCDIESEIDIAEVVTDIRKRYISEELFKADIKNVIVELKNKYGISYNNISKHFGISRATLRWIIDSNNPLGTVPNGLLGKGKREKENKKLTTR